MPYARALRLSIYSQPRASAFISPGYPFPSSCWAILTEGNRKNKPGCQFQACLYVQYIGLLAAAPELRNVGWLVVMSMQLCRLTVGRLACHAGHLDSVGIASTSALHAHLVLQGELSQMNGIGRLGMGISHARTGGPKRSAMLYVLCAHCLNQGNAIQQAYLVVKLQYS